LQQSIESSGGVQIGGRSQESLIKEEIIIGGGVACSGVSKFDFNINIISKISVSVGGFVELNSSYEEISKNGVLLSGRSREITTYNLETIGGVFVSSKSLTNVERDIKSTIALTASGSADLRIISNPTIIAKIVCSGSFVCNVNYHLDLDSFGLISGGSSQFNVTRFESSKGGCLIEGSSNFYKKTDLLSNASVRVSGSSIIVCDYNLVSSSGCVINGSFVVFANYLIVSKQSILTSGSGDLFVKNNIFSQIKLICGGFAVDEMDKIYFMEGGLQPSGVSNIFAYYRIDSLGGVRVAGQSIFGTIVFEDSLGGILISGLSLNVFVNSTSGGILVSGSASLIDQRVYSYIVSAKRQNRLLLGSNSEFDENNYYYEQPVGGCKVGGSLVVAYVSGASGAILAGTSQPIANRLYSYIVSTKRQNRLLLGSNSEFDENNYYYEQPSGGCEASGQSPVLYVSGASGITLGGNSQPVENRLYSYIVSAKRQNRLLLGSNSEFEENNYYYEQPQGGVAIGINFVVVQASGASGVTLGGNSQLFTNRLYGYIVSAKRQNRLLLGSNSEFDENNYYYEQPSGGCEASGQSPVLYVSGASGITLGGNSQPVTNKLHSYNSQGQVSISGFVSSKRSSYRNEFLGHFRLSGFADCRLVCQKVVCDDVGLKCKTKPPCESIVCDYSKEYFANCKYNKQNIRRCKTTSALLPAISNCRQKGYLPVRNRTKRVKERVTL
jgi:hypothetical protein